MGRDTSAKQSGKDAAWTNLNGSKNIKAGALAMLTICVVIAIATLEQTSPTVQAHPSEDISTGEGIVQGDFGRLRNLRQNKENPEKTKEVALQAEQAWNWWQRTIASPVQNLTQDGEDGFNRMITSIQDRMQKKHDEICIEIAPSRTDLPNAAKAAKVLSSLLGVVCVLSLICCLVWFCEGCLCRGSEEAAYHNTPQTSLTSEVVYRPETSKDKCANWIPIATILFTLVAIPLIWAFLHPQSVAIKSMRVQYTLHVPALIQVWSVPMAFVLVKMMLSDPDMAWSEIRGRVPESFRKGLFGPIAQVMASFSYFVSVIVAVLVCMEVDVEDPRSDPVDFIERSVAHILESSKSLCPVSGTNQGKVFLFTSGYEYNSSRLENCTAFETPQSAEATAAIFFGPKSVVLYVVGMLALILGEVMKLAPAQRCYLRKFFPRTWFILMRQNSAIGQLQEFKRFQRCASLAVWSTDRGEDFEKATFDTAALDPKLNDLTRRTEKFKCAWSGLLQTFGIVLIIPFFRIQSSPCFGFDKRVDTNIFAGQYEIGNSEQFFHLVRYASLGIVGVLAIVMCATVAMHSLPGPVQLHLHDRLKFPIGADLTDAASNIIAICIIIFLTIFGADLPFQQSEETKKAEKVENLLGSWDWRKLVTPQCFLVSYYVVQASCRLFVATILCDANISLDEHQVLKDEGQNIFAAVNKYVQDSDAGAEVKKIALMAYRIYAKSNPGYGTLPPKPGVSTSTRARAWLADRFGILGSDLTEYLAEQSSFNLVRAKSDFDFDEIVKELASHCPNLEHIDLRETRVTNVGVREIIAYHSRNLQSIDMQDTDVTDIGIMEIARGCPGLKEIGFGTNPSFFRRNNYATDFVIEEVAKAIRGEFTLNVPGTDAGEDYRNINNLLDREEEFSRKYPHVKFYSL